MHKLTELIRTRAPEYYSATPAAQTPEAQLALLPLVAAAPKCRILELVYTQLGADEARLRPEKLVREASLRGLLMLVLEGAWRAIVASSREAYTKTALPHEMLMVRCVRAIALIKLRMFAEAKQEIDALGRIPAELLKYEGYPATYVHGETGTIIPFSLRVVHALLPFFCTEPRQTLDKLYELRRLCASEKARAAAAEAAGTARAPGPPDSLDALTSLVAPRAPAAGGDSGQLIDEAANIALWLRGRQESDLAMWSRRETDVLLYAANVLCAESSFALAVRLYTRDLLPLHPNDPIYMSCLGRILVRCANYAAAERVFAAVEALYERPDEQYVVHVNRGWLCWGADQSGARAAQEAFERACETAPDRAACGSQYVAAANNCALCLLLQGKVQAAITMLEECMSANPSATLVEAVVMNMVQMRMLAEGGVEARRDLLRKVARYAPDDFDLSVLRL